MSHTDGINTIRALLCQVYPDVSDVIEAARAELFEFGSLLWNASTEEGVLQAWYEMRSLVDESIKKKYQDQMNKTLLRVREDIKTVVPLPSFHIPPLKFGDIPLLRDAWMNDFWKPYYLQPRSIVQDVTGIQTSSVPLPASKQALCELYLAVVSIVDVVWKAE